MNSFSHYTFGSVCEWMFVYMAGIDTDGPGFKKIVIHPHPDERTAFTKAEYHAIGGRIAIHWRTEGDVFTIDVTIPANSAATVYLPVKTGQEVTESGRPVEEAEGVRFLRREKQNSVYDIGSGNYRFLVE